MDPLSALIGGGASLLGGLLGSSSQKAINQQMLQQQAWSASGGFLPALVSNAQAAGINPLAALGQHGPGGPNLSPPDIGQGVRQAGAAIGAAVDPHAEALRKQEVEKGRAEIDRLHADIDNARVQGLLQRDALARLRSGGGATNPLAPEPFVKQLGDYGTDLTHRVFGDWLQNDSARSPSQVFRDMGSSTGQWFNDRFNAINTGPWGSPL